MIVTAPNVGFYSLPDPRDVPNYGPTQAAKYLRMSVSTLRTWVFGRRLEVESGRSPFPPLIQPASRQPSLLSFNNLVEAHMLLALRRVHEVPLSAVREALDVAAKELDVERLLLLDSLRTAFGEIFIQHYGRIVHLRHSQRIALEDYFVSHLQRVKLDSDHAPEEFYPFIRASTVFQPDSGDTLVSINPRLGFGQPVIAGTGIATAVLTERVNAGDDEASLARDYSLSRAQIRAAIIFEEAA